MWVTEFTVEGARADVVDIRKDKFVAYEIKSDTDTTARLANQVKSYDRVASELWLVTTQKQIAKASPIIQPWWGILVAEPTSKGVKLHEHLDARPNPTWSLPVAMNLLWTAEIDRIITHYKIKVPDNKPKRYKNGCILAQLGPDITKSAWLASLRDRYTRNPQLRTSGKKFVTP